MADQKAKEMEPVETQTVEIMPPDIENLIYVVRNKQVMFDFVNGWYIQLMIMDLIRK